MYDKEHEEQSPSRSMDRYESQCFSFKNFGCVTYAHVPDELRKKLEKRDKIVFLLVTLKTQNHTSCMNLSQEN